MFNEGSYSQLYTAIQAAWNQLSGEGSQSSVVVRSAISGTVGEELNESFLRAINTHNTPASQVRVVLDGVRVPPYHYSTDKRLKVGHHDIIDRSALNRYFERGATVMIDDAQTAMPVLDRLCTDMTEDSGIPSAGTIFASPPHTEGFALHQDAEDVVILQIAGAKAWTVFPALDRTTSSMLKRSECGEPIIETHLHAGDILIMPKGSPHKTESDSSQGSVHLTLGFYPTTLRDVLVRLLQECPSVELDKPTPDDAEDISAAALPLLTAMFDATALSARVPTVIDQLRSTLRGDTVEFQRPVLDSQRDGGQYCLLTKISTATEQFLAAQLNRPGDERLGVLLDSLKQLGAGETFTYKQYLAGTQDHILAQEALHAMLRLRFIRQVPAHQIGEV